MLIHVGRVDFTRHPVCNNQRTLSHSIEMLDSFNKYTACIKTNSVNILSDTPHFVGIFLSAFEHVPKQIQTEANKYPE
ncbi:hypothetical protein D3C85_1692970 [compost metagenome]